MTFDSEITLIGEEITRDLVGNRIVNKKETVVLANKRSVSRSEFYTAGQTGLKTELMFIVNTFEYNGETKLEFEGMTYEIIRVYENDFQEYGRKKYKDDYSGYTELIVGEKIVT